LILAKRPRRYEYCAAKGRTYSIRCWQPELWVGVPLAVLTTRSLAGGTHKGEVRHSRPIVQFQIPVLSACLCSCAWFVRQLTHTVRGHTQHTAQHTWHEHTHTWHEHAHLARTHTTQHAKRASLCSHTAMKLFRTFPCEGLCVRVRGVCVCVLLCVMCVRVCVCVCVCVCVLYRDTISPSLSLYVKLTYCSGRIGPHVLLKSMRPLCVYTKST
jgi:hypothetical protein